MKRVIGIDVDITVVRSDLRWKEWCERKSQFKLDFDRYPKGSVPYNFCKVYPDIEESYVMGFWRRDDLYDDMDVIPESIEAIRQIVEAGNEVVFVSVIKGNHHKSKFNLLNRNYGKYMSGFLATKEKEYARVDVMIDDRVDVLHRMKRYGVSPVLVDSPYTQGIVYSDTFASSMNMMYSWNDVPTILENLAQAK